MHLFRLVLMRRQIHGITLPAKRDDAGIARSWDGATLNVDWHFMQWEGLIHEGDSNSLGLRLVSGRALQLRATITKALASPEALSRSELFMRSDKAFDPAGHEPDHGELDEGQ